MKRIVILSIIVMLAQVPAHAQLGGLIQKAATKTTKVLEKKADSVINSAMDKQLDKQRQSRQTTAKQETTEEEELSYAAIMRKMPALPKHRLAASNAW